MTALKVGTKSSVPLDLELIEVRDDIFNRKRCRIYQVQTKRDHLRTVFEVAVPIEAAHVMEAATEPGVLPAKITKHVLDGLLGCFDELFWRSECE